MLGMVLTIIGLPVAFVNDGEGKNGDGENRDRGQNHA